MSPALVIRTNGVGRLAPGLYGHRAGDADGSGVVGTSDRQTVWLPQAGVEGYLPADLDLDGRVLADDRQRLGLPNPGCQPTVPGRAAGATGEDS